MKRLLISGIALIMVLPGLLSAQDPGSQRQKKDQNHLENEVFAGYGMASVYNFSSGSGHSPFNPSGTSNVKKNIRSSGSFFAGYGRLLSKLVTVGFMVGYLHTTYTRMEEYYWYPNENKTYYDENLFSGITFLQLSYINKAKIRLYSSIGVGLTVDYYSSKPEGSVISYDKKLLPAGQLTLLGIRFGRAFGGFLDFGVGTNSLLSAGLSYKFKD